MGPDAETIYLEFFLVFVEWAKGEHVTFTPSYLGIQLLCQTVDSRPSPGQLLVITKHGEVTMKFCCLGSGRVVRRTASQ